MHPKGAMKIHVPANELPAVPVPPTMSKKCTSDALVSSRAQKVIEKAAEDAPFKALFAKPEMYVLFEPSNSAAPVI